MTDENNARLGSGTSQNGTVQPDSFELVGDCAGCGGTMIETFSVVNNDERHVKMECRDCGSESELRHEFGSNPEDGAWSGVGSPEIKPVSWIDCPRCHGYGEIEDPICDLRRAMNGREHTCPNCNGSGTVARIHETDGEGTQDSESDRNVR